MKKTLEERVAAIEKRNSAVERDKAWETSIIRRLLIVGLTYVVAYTYLRMIENDEPFLNAVVPAGGYMLSTLVMQSVKDWWTRK